MSDPTWCVMPVLAGEAMTEAAVADLLAQTVPTRILIVNQGVEDSFRRRLERLSEEYPDRIFLWNHVPCLPSLSATWNRALQFCWESGASEAFVVNNDVRLRRDTASMLCTVLDQLNALFVTAVGVTAEQFEEAQRTTYAIDLVGDLSHRGGPDFSCFLISKEAHEKYPFDEMFTPCYGEDCDTHRRYMLGGDGERIFSINLPYLHIGRGSQTLKAMDSVARHALERRINEGSRAHYARKWGGPINSETFTIPFEEASAQDGVTNPDLQRGILGA